LTKSLEKIADALQNQVVLSSAQKMTEKTKKGGISRL